MKRIEVNKYYRNIIKQFKIIVKKLKKNTNIYYLKFP